jgi:NAD(P)-dependent dehydrogenase (short-subunit alcohol dehydrogenase family)
MDFHDKVAIVTGAGGLGCGRVMARRLAREGCRVVVSDRDEVGARETVRLIEADGGQAVSNRCDIGIDTDLSRLFGLALDHFGGVDILINNAGPGPHAGPLEGWVEAVEATLVGTMRATLLAIDAMQRRGGGAIVNIGSTSALGPGSKHSPWPGYDIAKAGVIRLTTTLGWLGEKENIRVNCVIPGWIASHEVATYVASLSPAERQARGVPKTLISLDQMAEAVLGLIAAPTLAGRLLLYPNDEPPRLIGAADPGYAMLEPWSPGGDGLPVRSPEG